MVTTTDVILVVERAAVAFRDGHQVVVPVTVSVTTESTAQLVAEGGHDVTADMRVLVKVEV